jgi:hypothetical protein
LNITAFASIAGMKFLWSQYMAVMNKHYRRIKPIAEAETVLAQQGASQHRLRRSDRRVFAGYV